MINSIKWEDLDPNYKPGQTVTNFSEVLRSLKSKTYVKLPEDFVALIKDSK